jgi:hypothetical protein
MIAEPSVHLIGVSLTDQEELAGLEEIAGLETVELHPHRATRTVEPHLIGPRRLAFIRVLEFEDDRLVQIRPCKTESNFHSTIFLSMQPEVFCRLPIDCNGMRPRRGDNGG